MDVIETAVAVEDIIYERLLRIYSPETLMGMREFALTEFIHISHGERSTITTKYRYDVFQRMLYCDVEYVFPELKGKMIESFTARQSIDNTCVVENVKCKVFKNGKEVPDRLGVDSEASNQSHNNTVSQFFLLNTYLMSHLPETVMEEREETKRVVSSKKHGKIKYRSEVNLIKRISLRTGDGASKNHAVITCPAWNVRGHYRQLKDGRSVYVRPYVKGKERKHADKIVDKTYHVKEETNHD